MENPTVSNSPGSVLMAMSGGVDSSAAAIILGRDGYEVVGATMLLIDPDNAGFPNDFSCGASGDHAESCLRTPDIEDAISCAESLGIPHHVLDFRDKFENEVVERFCKGYLSGSTPNPCIDCNRFIKFGALAKKRDELGLDYLSTGHYARREFDSKLGRYILRKGADAEKDQSYVLAFLTQDELAHTLLPLGPLSKSEVREIARRAGFGNASKSESQDICFVQDGRYADFIEGHTGKSSEAGPIFDEGGRLLGEHNGLMRYTIGQRKGLGIASSHPLYVIGKDVSSNALIAGPIESLGVREVNAKCASLVTYELAEVAGKELTGHAKTHYRHKGEACKAVFDGSGDLTVIFDNPVTKPADGQTLVVYDGDVVIGAAIIDGAGI